MDALMAAVGSSGLAARKAFLDLCEPDLPPVVAELAQQGHPAAVVVPLLFTYAFHARVDVPEAVDAATEPGLPLVLADILGTGDDVLDVLVRHTAAAAVDEGASVLLFAVGSSSEAANAAVHDLAARWSSRRSGIVRAGFGTAEPRAVGVLDGLPGPVVVVPLFVSAGLLLDALAVTATERGIRVLPPLGTALAPLVRERYQAALAAAAMGEPASLDDAVIPPHGHRPIA